MAAVAAQAAPLGAWPTAGPVRVVLEFQLAADPTRRPDVDNLAKAVLDALSPSRAGGDTSIGRGRWAALLWHDDAQVVELVVRKRRGEPGLHLEVDASDDRARPH
jgi:Holliday junction resolvase RusA-like endonuclease